MKNFSRPAAFLLALSLSPLMPSAFAEPGRKFPNLTDAERYAVESALPAKPADAPAKPRKLLVFYRTEGFVHDSIPVANETLRLIGERTGAYTATITDDMAVFEPKKLAAYDAVAFVSTTQLAFENPVHRKALLDFVESGKGLVGIHAATDNFPTWPEGQALIGGCFHSHPWTSGQVVAVKLDDPDHTLNAGFEKRGYWIKEEIYKMKAPYSREKQRVLVSLDMSRKENERPKAGVTGTEGDYGISWIRTAGKGRVFNSSLGHNKDIYFVPAIQRHFLDGIRFALGDLPADSVPSAALATKPVPALAPDDKTTLQDQARAKLVASTLAGLPEFRDGHPFGELTAASNLIRTLPAPERAAAEKTLVAQLERTDLDPEARSRIIHILARTGSAAAVPALAKQALTPEFASEASTGLAAIADNSAEKALIGLVGQGPSAARVTWINALALRRSPEAFAALAKVGAEGTADSVAALQAIAAAGTPEALKTLVAVNAGDKADARTAALIAAADRILRDPKASRAGVGAVAREILKDKNFAFRIDAARLLVLAEGPGAAAELTPLLKDESSLVRRAVARTITFSGDRNAIGSLVKTFSGDDVATQGAVLAAAYDSGSPAALPAINAGLASADAGVKARAVLALARCGDESAVEKIAPLLAAEPEIAAAARIALGLPISAGFGDKVRASLTGQTSPVVKAGLLTVLADRRDRAGFAIAATLAKDTDAKLRQTAFETIASFAGPGDLPAVLATASDQKKGGDRRAWQKAVFTSAARSTDAAGTVTLLGAAIAKAPAADAAVLIGALTQVSGKEAGEALRGLLARPEVEGRKEVIRALASARNRNARALLLETAGKASDSGERTLALRGYLDTIAALDLKPAERVSDYRAAWPLAGAEEKDTIVAAVKEIKSDDAKKFLKEITPATPAAAPAPAATTQGA